MKARLTTWPLAALAALAGCDLPADMSDQARYDPLEASRRFADGASARRLVPGVVPRPPAPAERAPSGGAQLAAVRRRLEAGRELFGAHCSPCHGLDGAGLGMVVQRGFPQPPPLWDARVVARSDAELAGVITHGRGKMPAYGPNLPDEAAREAVVLFVRALQRSRRASPDDAPPAERARLEAARRRAPGEVRPPVRTPPQGDRP